MAKAKRFFRLSPYVLIAATLIIILVQWSCAVNPVTGKKEIMLVSESMEIQMGKEIDRGLKMEYGLYDDPDFTAYVNRIGQGLVPFSHRPHLQYHFAILDTPVENAFAAPGGYIYITRGLLAMLNSEAEIATVLGHELGHVAARHSARQITRSILFQVGIILASELSKDFRKIAPLTLIATQLLFLKYSRSDEYQADALGIEYSMKSNYAAKEMVTFFSSLERMTASEGGPKIPNFLSTHPLTPLRIQKVKDLLQVQTFVPSSNVPKLAVEKNKYVKMTDGLIYGENPLDGYVEGNTFYHPNMQFSFRVPSGWQVNNTPMQVVMSSPDGKAVVLLKAEVSDEGLDVYSDTMMKNLSNPKIIQEGYRYINGLDAYHTLLALVPPPDEDGTQPKANEKMAVNLNCIRKDRTIFTFFSAAAEPDYPAYRNEIGRVVNSFSPLRNPRYLNRVPQKVYVKQVRGGQTLRALLGNEGVAVKDWEKIALINAMQLDQALNNNQLVKIIK